MPESGPFLPLNEMLFSLMLSLKPPGRLMERRSVERRRARRVGLAEERRLAAIRREWYFSIVRATKDGG